MITAIRAQSSTFAKLRRAHDAAGRVADLSTEQKDNILAGIAGKLADNQRKVLSANGADLAAANLRSSSLDRLLLNAKRVASIVAGIEQIIGLPDPIGEIVTEWDRPNGLHIRKLRVPLGVVGMIYESRPNVTVEAAVLALKAGNAVVLRGGREAAKTNEVLVDLMAQVPGLPEGAVELLDSSSRESVDELMSNPWLVDVLIPRGGSDLIEHVVAKSRVPVIVTGAGNCHIYVDDAADFDIADRIVMNAKTQRPTVCNSAEKLLVHRSVAREYVPRIVQQLRTAGVEVRGDAETCRIVEGCLDVVLATPEDWSTEYMDLRIAVGVVDSVDDAIAHINYHSTKHSEAIVTRNAAHAERFLQKVDSAAVYWNASTRFTDGGEFGFGGEVGISTQKLHCRGPFGLNEMTTTKYQIFGSGQVRV
jgi:glutamate-5-semialdehyde dehydrogenase